MKKLFEYHFSSIPGEKLFLKIVNQIVELGSGKKLDMIDGLDQRYWDLKIKDEVLTIHSDTFLGIVAFKKNKTPFSDSLFSILQKAKATIFKNICDLESAFPKIVQLFGSLSVDFSNTNFQIVSIDPFQTRCTSKDIERTIREYGKQLVPIPTEEIEKTELTVLDDGSGFFGDMSLWTKEEGCSDLSILFTITENKIEIDDIRVM